MKIIERIVINEWACRLNTVLILVLIIVAILFWFDQNRRIEALEKQHATVAELADANCRKRNDQWGCKPQRKHAGSNPAGGFMSQLS